MRHESSRKRYPMALAGTAGLALRVTLTRRDKSPKRTFGFVDF